MLFSTLSFPRPGSAGALRPGEKWESSKDTGFPISPDALRDRDVSGMTPIPAGAKALVTGATGFTGSVLVRKLVNAGAEVHAIARETSHLANLADLNIKWYNGQIYDEQIVAEAAKDVQYVFHLAAAYREAKYGDEMGK